MTADANLMREAVPGFPGGLRLLLAEQEVLARVKQVAQLITERVRQVVDDGQAHTPGDPTADPPPR